jgi:hypothetical protein
VPIQAELGVVRKVRAELQEERPEVSIQAVEVVMIHQRRRLHDPGVGLTGFRVVPFLGAIYSALLLRFAHEDDTFGLSKSSTTLVGNIIFTLAFLERDHGDVVISDIAFN